jgi:hypothetical protein
MFVFKIKSLSDYKLSYSFTNLALIKNTWKKIFMKNIFKIVLLVFIFSNQIAQAQTVTITVDAGSGHRAISPYLYGKNNSLYDIPSQSLSNAQWLQYNNATFKLTQMQVEN